MQHKQKRKPLNWLASCAHCNSRRSWLPSNSQTRVRRGTRKFALLLKPKPESPRWKLKWVGFAVVVALSLLGRRLLSCCATYTTPPSPTALQLLKAKAEANSWAEAVRKGSEDSATSAQAVHAAEAAKRRAEHAAARLEHQLKEAERMSANVKALEQEVLTETQYRHKAEEQLKAERHRAARAAAQVQAQLEAAKVRRVFVVLVVVCVCAD